MLGIYFIGEIGFTLLIIIMTTTALSTVITPYAFLGLELLSISRITFNDFILVFNFY